MTFEYSFSICNVGTAGAAGYGLHWVVRTFDSTGLSYCSGYCAPIYGVLSSCFGF